MELNPAFPEANDGFVRTAIRAGRADEAERKLKTMTGPSAALVLGTLYRRLGRFEEALTTIDPLDRESLLLGADVSSDRGDAAEMKRYGELMLELDPSDREAAGVLAEARLRGGDLAGAARESASILALHPGEIRALQVHAVAHAELGNENLARESFEKLLELHPDDWVQLNNLGKLELSAGNEERGAELFERAVDVNSRNVEGYRGLEAAAEKTKNAERLERARSMLRFLDQVIQRSGFSIRTGGWPFGAPSRLPSQPETKQRLIRLE